MNSPRDPTSRLRATLNPLRTTSLGNSFHPGVGTPHSAISAVPTPHSAIQPYNPQQWAASPVPERHHYEAQQSPPLPPPLPPPPYSPPRSQRPVSMVYDSPPANANTSAARAPLPQQHHRQQYQQQQQQQQQQHQHMQHRPSPDPVPMGQTSFAPPPGTSRGGSRERRFGLPFGRRRDADHHPQPVQPQTFTNRSPSDSYSTHQSGGYPAQSLSPQPLQPPQPPQPPPPQPPLQQNHFLQQHAGLPPLHIPAAQQNVVAPGSRRAASTGAITTPTSATRSRSSSQVRWESGLPLPPPPPGPPPSSSRSASANRAPGVANPGDPVMAPPTRRPPPTGVTVLGPVPPTPAGWFDMDQTQAQPGSATVDSTASSSNTNNSASTPRQLTNERQHATAEGRSSLEDNLPNRTSFDNSTASVTSSRDLGDSADSTNSTHSSHSPEANTAGIGSSLNSALGRTGAVRGEKTLRERRTESRTRMRSARNSVDMSHDADTQPQGEGHGRSLSNIVIPSSGSVGSLMRRPTITKSTPRSGGGGPNSGRALMSLQQQRDTSPRTGDTVTGGASGLRSAGAATPPFSPYPVMPGSSKSRLLQATPTSATAAVPKALPTPPPQSRSSSSAQLPAASSLLTYTKEMAVHQTAEQFSSGTIDRFNVFAQQEAASTSDAERVRLFAEFIVNESRVRRERYASAIGAMGSEIFDLTRDLFRPMPAALATAPPTVATTGPLLGRRESINSMESAGAEAGVAAFTPQSSEPSRSHRGSIASVFRDGPSSAPLAGVPGELSAETDGALEGRPVAMSPTGPSPSWAANNYMPSLSPILSMSITDQLDDGSSRGRTASRWWESSENGGDNAANPGANNGEARSSSGDRLGRSKRESKYMGVPKEAREALQWADNPAYISNSNRSNPVDAGVGSSSNAAVQAGPTDYSAYEGSSAYPPEKSGLPSDYLPSPELVRTPQALTSINNPHFRHSLLSSTTSTPGLSAPNTPNALPPPPPHPAPALAGSAPISTPSAMGLPETDVSRLVTLPPPYPRHHPAVNNNHPELSATRSAVRTLSSLAEVDAAYDKYNQATEAAHKKFDQETQTQKDTLRTNLQAEVSAGRMSYADAAAIEASSNVDDLAREKERDKADFDRFQQTVVMPVNELLTARIALATKHFADLQGRLFSETGHPNPNTVQEEGDEQPELLETLTLLKWVFEAREVLHRAIYDLLTDRNNRYRDMVLTPYRRAGNSDKLRDAEAFFANDAATRASSSAEEALRRLQEFREVVESNVTRGVEVQLSAFWDIAPPLVQLLDQVPLDLRRFAIQIPAAEYAETPSYHAHPMQYLFSLLLHAEKSTHQFIESQTNLLCLLHEVKEAALAAKARVLEHEGRTPEAVAAATAEERARLTDDLKDKVRVVQDQWRAGLGESINLVKERVGGWLLETGGWDESLEDGGVGSV